MSVPAMPAIGPKEAILRQQKMQSVSRHSAGKARPQPAAKPCGNGHEPPLPGAAASATIRKGTARRKVSPLGTARHKDKKPLYAVYQQQAAHPYLTQEKARQEACNQPHSDAAGRVCPYTWTACPARLAAAGSPRPAESRKTQPPHPQNNALNPNRSLDRPQ